MKKSMPLIIISIIAISVLFISIFIYPTMYKYQKLNNEILRINKITGTVNYLSGGNWVSYEYAKETMTASSKEQGEEPTTNPDSQHIIPSVEFNKITASLKYREYNSSFDPKKILTRRIEGTIYNGTSKTINDLIVEIIIYSGESSDIDTVKKYSLLNEEIEAYSDKSISTTIELNLSDKKYEIKLVEAKWK